MNWIERGMIAGGEIPINDNELRFLSQQGVRAIITLTEYELTWLDQLNVVLLADFELLHLPIVDTHPPTKQQVEQVFSFVSQMQKVEKPVYVHCEAGIGRTGTMLHAISLMSGLELEEVKLKIELTRPMSQWSELSDRQRLFLQQLDEDLYA